MNVAIGIDPGIDTGGLAMIPENGEIKVIMTPRISAKGDIDLRAISSFFLDAADKIQEEGGGMLAIAVEDVHSIHNSSAASNFTFGGQRREPSALRYDGGDDGTIRIASRCQVHVRGSTAKDMAEGDPYDCRSGVFGG